MTQKAGRVVLKERDMTYTPSLGYKLLEEDTVPQLNWTSLWKLQTPPNTMLFMWNALHNTLPTLDLLKKRNIVEDKTCKWCLTGDEDSENLFWNCTLLNDCWEILLVWCDISRNITPFSSLTSALKYFSASLGGGYCLIAMLWTLWLTRNECVFKNTRIPKQLIPKLIKTRAWEWSVASNQITNSFKA